MLAWVAYLLLVSATLSVAGFALERSLRAHGLTIRWIWLCVLCASLVLPVVLSAAARALPAGGAASRPPSAVTSTAAAPAVSASRTLQFPAASRGSVAPDLDPLIAALWLASSAATALVVLAGCEYGRRRRRAWRRIS